MATQANRRLKLITELGQDVLLLERFGGVESLGQPFEYQIEAISQNDEFDFDELIGQPASIQMIHSARGADDGGRFFHGRISKVSHRGYDHHGMSSYELTLVPWLWFLSLKSDCRIFQNLSVLEILKEVFSEAGFSDFSCDFLKSYPVRDYVVQYRESTLNFIQRLLQHEGIYYYWLHEKGKHTMILCDAMSNHQKVAGYEEVYYRAKDAAVTDEDYIHSWEVSKEASSASVSINAYNFMAPTPSTNTKLFCRDSMAHSYRHGNNEVYDNEGGYQESQEGERLVQVRRQEAQCRSKFSVGETNARGMTCGYTFSPLDIPREDQNVEQLVISTTIRASCGNYASGTGQGEEEFACRLTAVPLKGYQYRPERTAIKPFVKGPQTAMVTGPNSEEIYVDDHARVKVQFHWDREGVYDSQTSCWVRVSQPWAGSTYGGLAIPRIGQEVIIDFLEGDPDRPILTGRVYNADSMPIVSNAGRDDNPARSSRDVVKKNREKRAKAKGDKLEKTKKRKL